MFVLSLEDELDEARRDLAKERRAKELHQRSEIDGRVCDRDRWLETLRGSDTRIDGLRDLIGRLEAELELEKEEE